MHACSGITFKTIEIMLMCKLPYSRERGKTFVNGWKIRFAERNISWVARWCRCQKTHTLNFAEKTFANSYKTSKFVKVFSLKSFPLYSNF